AVSKPFGVENSSLILSPRMLPPGHGARDRRSLISCPDAPSTAMTLPSSRARRMAGLVVGCVPSAHPIRSTTPQEHNLQLETSTMMWKQGRALQAFRRVQAWFAEHPQVLSNARSSQAALTSQLDALKQVVDAMSTGAAEQTTQKSQATLAAKDEK